MYNGNNPVVSFCILTYNQQNYISDAIRSAFNQTYKNLEIIISDDYSTDDTYDIIEKQYKLYEGDFKIVINRNERNLGIRDHFNKVVYELAQGDIIVIAAGDDISHPERVQKTVDFLNEHKHVKSLHFESTQVDAELKNLKETHPISDNQYSIITLDDYVNKMKNSFWLYSGDSRAFKREIVDFFPRLVFSHNEDIPMFVRCIMMGASALIREPMVMHRIHSNNVSLKLRFKQEGSDLFKQIHNDIEYAYVHNKITKLEKIKLEIKKNRMHINMISSDIKKILCISKAKNAIKKIFFGYQ